MTGPSYKAGDVFLLFQELHYDFHSGEPPIEILENLYFDETPSELLNPPLKLLDSKRLSSPSGVRDLLEYAGWVNYVLPGHNLTDGKIVHCCLRYDSGKTNQYPDFGHSALFATFITALRLQKPCSIQVGGIFTFGGDDEPIQHPALWNLTSPDILTDGSSYSQKDIQISSNIAKELLEISQSGEENRIKSALIYFSQVTQGFSKSLQLSYLGLWASLEAIFQPTVNKAETLARRITAYLSPFSLPHFSSPQDMGKWLKNEYIHRRSRFIHGSYIALPKLQNVIKGHVAFPKLHEITRLCLLGFLSLEKSKRKQILQQKGNQLQHTLDNLGQAQGKYLDQQKIYL